MGIDSSTAYPCREMEARVVDKETLQELRKMLDPETVAMWLDEVEAFRHAPRETPPPKDQGLLTPREVAARLGLHLETVYTLVHSNQMRNIRVGRYFKIPPDAVDEWVLKESSKKPPWQY